MTTLNYINIITAGADVGSVFAGKSAAPDAILSVGLVEQLTTAGFTVSVHNALPDGPARWTASAIGPNGVRNEEAAVEVCKAVKSTVTAVLEAGTGAKTEPPPPQPFTLILGGECLITPAILSALTHHSPGTRIGLLYIDADSDLSYPHEAGSTGNIASMTMTHLTLRPGALASMQQFSRPDGTGVCNSSNTVLFGLNLHAPSTTRYYLGYLLDHHFRIFSSQAVIENAVARAEEALRWLEERVDYIWVHFDVDVVDPGLFPLGNVPNWTGIGFEHVRAALGVFLKGEKVGGLSVAEVNPDHDPDLGMTRRLVESVVGALAGRTRLA